MIVVQMEATEVMEAVEEAEEADVTRQAILTEVMEARETMGEEAEEGLHIVVTNLHSLLREMAEQARRDMEETKGIQLHLSLMEILNLEARAVLV